ncbi:tetratricopeptide repeat domain-containing protein, partial [Dimargaris verticillata]
MAPYTYAQVVERLTHLRQTGERAPLQVCEMGRWLFQQYYGHRSTHSNDPQLWAMAEQVFTATLDVGDWQLADQLLTALRTKFSDSRRIDLLSGMLLEAQGQFRDAERIYDKILEDDPINMRAAKRKVAILKAQDQIPEAIARLNDYLKEQYTDQQGWLELCELYLADNRHGEAGYCLEELILLQPVNHIYHLKYAELQYTMHNYGVAFKYYCRVLELCSDHLRGLYGLKLCVAKLRHLQSTNAVSTGKDISLPDPAVLDQMDVLITDRLSAMYTQSVTTTEKPLADLVHCWVQSLSA